MTEKKDKKKLRIDIHNPKISQVIKGTEGKIILIHSNERKLGKTKVGSQLPNPYYLRFEQGMNAISGLPYADLENWQDFKLVNKQLISQKKHPETGLTARETYDTIIIDTIDVAIKWCEFYICAQGGVTRLNDGNNGYGLWKEYENEWFKEINKLTNAGYCIYAISHSEPVKFTDVDGEEYSMLMPKGDKRTIDLICDLADFIGYVKSNGVDENGSEILSSCYFVETPYFLAGSRFDMPEKLEVFSAENLQKAIYEAIEKEEQKNGIGITQDELTIKESKVKYSFAEIMELITELGSKMFETNQERVTEIIEEYLGPNKKINDATKKQLPQLELILVDLQELAEELKIEV